MDTEAKSSLECQMFETNVSFLKKANLAFYHKHWKWKRVKCSNLIVTNVLKFIFYFYQNNLYAELEYHIILHYLK